MEFLKNKNKWNAYYEKILNAYCNHWYNIYYVLHHKIHRPTTRATLRPESRKQDGANQSMYRNYMRKKLQKT